jgi:hypothetical protein
MRQYAVEEPVDTQKNAAWIQKRDVQALFGEGRLKRLFRAMLNKWRMLKRYNGTPEQTLLALVRQRESVLNHLSSAYKPLKKGEP